MKSVAQPGGHVEDEVGEEEGVPLVKSVVKSVLRPGVALGQDDGTVNLVNRLSDIARGEIAGYNASELGSYRQLFPRLSKKDYLKLSYTDLPDSPVTLRQVLSTVSGLREQDILDFSTARRLARQDMGNGQYRDVVVPNIKALATEMDLADYDELDGIELEVIPGLADRARKRQYTLTQVMSDLDVKAKYQLPVRVYVTAERLAATDAPAAAQVFQDAMNSVQDHTRVVVTPGLLAIDNVQAANAIKMMAYGCAAVSSAVRSEVVAGHLFMYSYPEGENGWHVLGPLRRAADVAEVFRIVSTYGPRLPSGLLSVDLVQLKIDIFDGESYGEPVLQFNASFDGISRASPGLSSAAAKTMTSGQRSALAAMKDKLLPVLNRDGRQLATAIRVTDRHVLVNDHVHAADAQATVSGRRLSLSTRVARDVWAAECPGSFTPWVFREPEVGEMAVILYMVDGTVSCSSPVFVETVGLDTVMTSGSHDVVRGVSGGALVALSDFALFGMHSASVGSSLLNYRFGPDQLEEVVGADSSPSISRVAEVESFASVVMKRFVERGLGSTFRAACSAVVPLWKDGDHHGMAVLDGGNAFSTIGESGIYYNYTGSQSLYFPAGAGEGLARAPCAWSSASVPLRRTARLGERVFILGFDDTLYVTDQTDVAHVYAGGKGFVLRPIPGLDKSVTGGLVMAWDGSVVGLAGEGFTTSTPIGYGLVCRPMFKRELSMAPGAREVLSAQFPYLQLDQWADDVLEEVFSHSSVAAYKSGKLFNAGNKPLAVMGSAFMRYLGAKVLRDQGVPSAEWSDIIQGLQSKSALAALACKHGFDVCIKYGDGVRLSDGSRAHVEAVEALVGATADIEGENQAIRLCSDLGLLRDDDAGTSVVNVSEAAVE